MFLYMIGRLSGFGEIVLMVMLCVVRLCVNIFVSVSVLFFVVV